MVPPASHRVSRVPWYSGYCCRSSDFVYWAFTVFGVLSQNTSTIIPPLRVAVLNPRKLGSLVWPLSISLAATSEIDFSFSSCCYLDVSVHNVPLRTLCIYVRITEVCSVRFPHSDISGSKVICTSPKLFAAYHVFHRLLVPRHSPYALSCLTSFCNISIT